MVKKPWKEAPVKRKPFDRSSGKAGRNGMIAKVHIAKKDLGLDDDTYRALLANITGKDSCSKMSMPDLEKLIKSLVNDYGWKVKIKNPKTGIERPFKPKADERSQRFIFRLWVMLAQYNVVNDKSREACNSWMRRVHGLPVEWCGGTELNRATEQLKAWGKRIADERNDDAMNDDFKGAF